MNVRISQSTIHGKLEAPPSKSYTHRAIIMASLSKTSRVIKPLISEDTCATVSACEAIGATINPVGDVFFVDGVQGEPTTPDNIIDCQNSGTTLRFMIGVCSLINGTTVLTGDASLRGRPNSQLIDVLNELGAKVAATKDNGMAPVIVQGVLSGGRSALTKPMSSQFLSALLIACPLCQADTTLNVHQLQSRPYVDMTLELLNQAQINVSTDYNEFMVPCCQNYADTDFLIPGDFSSAALQLSAAAITNSRVSVHNLLESKQGDKKIVAILKEMGANISWERDVVTTDGAELRGVTIDASDIPDLVPILAVLGAYAEGTTDILNVSNLRYKETDRLAAIITELRKMQVDIKQVHDVLRIKGGSPKGASLSGYGDHRIVMALAVAALAADGQTQIDTAESVKVSYPDFFDDIFALGANLEALSDESV
ncbi:MAG: 3-phosphoshikimate 1-carboxyvinyltransferase [Euryarchaeota archaeon]|nr:3-phosphoshikimate 1-carboxyvinyltransferase [Euryarchaeota archaeon]